MSNEQIPKKFDLEGRTAKFGEAIILWQEAKELNLISNTIYKKVSN